MENENEQQLPPPETVPATAQDIPSGPEESPEQNPAAKAERRGRGRPKTRKDSDAAVSSPAPAETAGTLNLESETIPMPQPKKILRRREAAPETELEPIPENVQPDLLVPPTVVPVEPSETSAPYQNEDKTQYEDSGAQGTQESVPSPRREPQPNRDSAEPQQRDNNFQRRDNNRNNENGDFRPRHFGNGDQQNNRYNNNGNSQNNRYNNGNSQNNRYNNRNNNNNNNRRFVPNGNRYQASQYQPQYQNGANPGAAEQQGQNPEAQAMPEPAVVREKAPDLNITDMQEKSMQELTVMARELGIEGVGALEKSKLVFEILRVTTERSGAVYGSGFLEILPDGFGFLRSQAYSYLPSSEDIYLSPSQIRRFSVKTGDFISG